MMKSPDEIKKGLECCLGDTYTYHCDECPYADNEAEVDDGCGDNGIELLEDALALIQQLETQNAELIKKIEQLQTVGSETEELLRLGGCDTCKYRDVDAWIEPCMSCENRDKWEMRKGE